MAGAGRGVRGVPGQVLVLLLAVAAVTLGFAAAQGRAALVAAPVLVKPAGPLTLSGRIAAVEPSGPRWRLYLNEVRPERPLPAGSVAGGAAPERVRLTVGSAEGLRPGQVVSLRARLLPPPEPTLPGGYDIGRALWFEGIGAIGFTVSRPRVMAEAPESLTATGKAVRQRVTERLLAGVGGDSGKVAAALVTGAQGALPQTLRDAYRDSGLAHLLAISGLHMAMVGGLVYVSGRALWALVPWLALRIDGRQVMAPLAIAATAGYLALSGGSVPAVRAFLMALVVFAAVLLGRSAFSPRTLAVAALVVLAVRPEALVGASFQLSFAAVSALIAVYGALAPPLAAWRAAASGPVQATARTLGLYVGGILLSTVVAGLATAPFAAFHFHTFVVWGVAANLAAVPLVTLWVMPWLVAGVLLMPFGLDAVAWAPVRWGLDGVQAVAETVAGWPHATIAVPPFPVAGLVVLSMAGLWLAFAPLGWRWRWPAAAVLPVLATLPWLTARPPDLLVAGDGAPMAVRSGDGLVLRPGRGDGFTRDTWAEAWGRGAGRWSAAGLEGGAGPLRLACDPLGCVLASAENPGSVALAFHPLAVAEDCRPGLVMVAPLFLPRGACPGGRLIDRWALLRGGTHAFYLADGGTVRVETVAQARGRRPWAPAAGQD